MKKLLWNRKTLLKTAAMVGCCAVCMAELPAAVLAAAPAPTTDGE